MKREEAVKLVKEVTGMSLDWDDTHYEALQMAIEALEQQKPIEKFENAKDHIFKLASDYKCWDNRLTHDEALELCHILEQESCEDAVSRKTVLNTLNRMDSVLDENRTVETYKELLIACYNDLPPVTPAPQGKWIIDDKDGGRIWHCHCSNCKKDPQIYVGGSENWWLVRLPKFCPNCGSKMDEMENLQGY